MAHSFSPNDFELEPQPASARGGKGRGGNRGIRTSAAVLDMPDPPGRTRLGTLMDRLRGLFTRRLHRKKS